jgi:2-amino-4-hydroxy-6-hydroxymethyldihydropteridine diphosphokinase
MDVVVGLGGNVGSVAASLAAARSKIAEWARVRSASRLFRTSPVGLPDQPAFLNAALRIGIGCTFGELVDRCQELERAAGRDRSTETRWGPRPLDIDLLVARDAVHRGLRLELPHARFHERAFALVPAAEVAPDWRHPLLGETLLQLAERALEREHGAVLEVLDSGLWQASAAS